MNKEFIKVEYILIKMKKATVILSLLITNSLFSQNLIPNSGFEEILDCPDPQFGNTQIELAKPWTVVRENSTSDLWNDCVFEPGNDPWNMLIYYEDKYLDNPAHSGLSRSHIGIYYLTVLNKREYIQVPLQEALVVGQAYKLRFYAKVQTEWSIIHSHFGALFTVGRLNYIDLFPYSGQMPPAENHKEMIDHEAQVLTDGIFGSQEDYELIEGTFIAEEAYTHMSVGVFVGDENLDTKIINDLGNMGSGFVLDDFSLEQIPLSLLKHEDSNLWKVYTDKTHIHVQAAEDVSELRLYDLMGRRVFSEKLSETNRLTLPSLTTGIYIYQIFNKNKQSVHRERIYITNSFRN